MDGFAVRPARLNDAACARDNGLQTLVNRARGVVEKTGRVQNLVDNFVTSAAGETGEKESGEVSPVFPWSSGLYAELSATFDEISRRLSAIENQITRL